MIREKHFPVTERVLQATCDACGGGLALNDTGVHHGVLTREHGYGHPWDTLGCPGARSLDLCDTCWQKACAAVGFTPTLERLTEGTESP